MTEPSEQLQVVWAKIPDAHCQGLCASSCGPVDCSLEERRLLRERGIKLRSHVSVMLDLAAGIEPDMCPALVDGRCSVYEVRPTVCFAPGTWIYTSRGPTRIETIFAGDRVYGADGKLHRVLATRSTPYSGTLVGVRHSGTHLPAWCTPEHEWLVARQKDKRRVPKPEWRAAETIIGKRKNQEGDYLTYPARYQNVSSAEKLEVLDFLTAARDGDVLRPFTGSRAPARRVTQDLPAVIPIESEFLFMVGLFLAEGNSSSRFAGFTMHRDEELVLRRVAAYLDGIGVRSQLKIVRNASVLAVPSSLFGRLMGALCGTGAGTKRLHPQLFQDLSAKQLWEVYEAWDLGDGRRNARHEGARSTATASEELAVQMSMVAMLNGYFPRLYVNAGRDRNWAAFDLNLPASNWRPTKPLHGTKNMTDGRFIYTPSIGEGQYRRAVELTREYEGPVFDIQVEDVESFVTSSGIAHNCRLWGAGPAMPCPWGCEPDVPLTIRESAETLGESFGLTIPKGYPLPVIATQIEPAP